MGFEASGHSVQPSADSSITGDPLVLHQALAELNRLRMTPSRGTSTWASMLSTEQQLRLLEHRFVESERARVRDWAAQAPTQADSFVKWFVDLVRVGPGQGDPLFPWLASEATLAQLRWFLSQEMAGEAGFDDLVALTQLRLPNRVKLEMARNYWDEMGRGKASGMHGPMLAQLGQVLRLTPSGAGVTWEALALGNLMMALAANRHYTYESVGALGVIELTAPGRANLVNVGLKRLGLCGDARRYYALHATLDVQHSEAWNREVLWPLVEQDPQRARSIAEGALMRLAAGARCFVRYRAELMRS